MLVTTVIHKLMKRKKKQHFQKSLLKTPPDLASLNKRNNTESVHRCHDLYRSKVVILFIKVLGGTVCFGFWVLLLLLLQWVGGGGGCMCAPVEKVVLQDRVSQCSSPGCPGLELRDPPGSTSPVLVI